MSTERKFYQIIAGPALVAGALLLIPLLAMQFSDQVVWDLTDFLIAGILLFGTGFTYKLLTRKSGEVANRVAMGFALFTGLLLVWVNLAVGVIGSEDNPANLMYFGVLAVGIISASIARFQPQGMSVAMFAMALAQALAAVIALIVGLSQSPVSSVVEILGVNGFFVSLFVISAFLFRYAAQKQPPANLEPNG